MEIIKKRAANLLTVKSIVTVTLTAVFAYLSVCGHVSTDQFLTVFTVVIAFYFGTQAKKNEGLEMNGAAVKAYSLALDGGKKVAPHFKVREFACHDGTDTVFIAPALAELLEKIRVHFGKPVVINSGYRTESWNKKQGGAARSQHKYGTAADIRINGVTPRQIADYAEKLMPRSGGIGIYGSFCHVDVRAKRSRWPG